MTAKRSAFAGGSHPHHDPGRSPSTDRPPGVCSDLHAGDCAGLPPCPWGIYNHFASKEAIFKAIIQERHPLLEVLPALQTVEGETVEEFVRNAARTLVGELRRRPDFLNLMLIEIVEFKSRTFPGCFADPCHRCFPS